MKKIKLKKYKIKDLIIAYKKSEKKPNIFYLNNNYFINSDDFMCISCKNKIYNIESYIFSFDNENIFCEKCFKNLNKK